MRPYLLFINKNTTFINKTLIHIKVEVDLKIFGFKIT